MPHICPKLRHMMRVPYSELPAGYPPRLGPEAMPARIEGIQAMTCAHCQADNPAAAKFCGHCGVPIPATSPASPASPPSPGGSGSLDDIFKLIGMGVVVLIIIIVVAT
jgi:hypothetical protein